MGRDKTSKFSVFQRLTGDKSPKPSVFPRIKIGGKFSSSSPTQDENFVFNHLGEVNEVQSSVPLSMKCVFFLDVKTDSSLKVKRCTSIITSYETSSNSKVKIKDEEQASSQPITVWEADDLKGETG